MIADSLGIDYPRQTRSRLAEWEKRLLAVTLDIDPRQLTAAQLTLLGKQIAPDVTERARARQAHGITASGRSRGKDAHGQISTSDKTRDHVAATVGLGSGKTYERSKKVLDAVAEEAPALLPGLEQGALTIRAAKAEVKQKRKRKEVERIRQEPPPLPEGRFVSSWPTHSGSTTTALTTAVTVPPIPTPA
jgi:hypothetical protein